MVKHARTIEREAARQGVDPDLVKAIVYVENAHGGHYGWIAEQYRIARSILPMNIRHEPWSKLGFSPRDLDHPILNIRAGVMLLRRIQDRLIEPTVSKVATLYNSLPQDVVSNYGARVAEVYRTKEWRRMPILLPFGLQK